MTLDPSDAASSSAREQLLNEILERAATDPTFRGRLLENPKSVIYAEFGVQIPNNYRIRFVERDPELDALVVLPDFRGGNGELSEADLEEVCGGSGGDDGGGSDW